MFREMINLFRSFAILLLIISPSIIGSEAPIIKANSSSTELLFSQYVSITDKLIDQINKVPADDGYICIENPYLTETHVIDALIKAAQNKVKIIATVGRGTNQKICTKLKDAGIEVNERSFIHLKRLLFADKLALNKNNDDDTKIQQTLVNPGVYVGSHNCSNIAENHQEVVAKDLAADIAQQHYDDQQKLIKLTKMSAKEDKSPIKKSPAKPTVMNSNEKMLSEGKKRRIEKLLENLNDEDCIDITSMTFDTKNITDALIDIETKAKEQKKNPQLRLLLDSSALKHRDLLNPLHTAGIKIFIYNHDQSEKIWNKFPTLQHTKLFARYKKDSDSHLVIVSTGNCAQRSDQEYNIDMYYPNNKKLYDTVRAYCDDLQKLCMPYGDILKEEKEKEEKQKKRKNNDDGDKKESPKKSPKKQKNK